MKVIIEYQTRDNRNYFREWFNKLTKVNQIKVHKRLERIANGNYGDTPMKEVV